MYRLFGFIGLLCIVASTFGNGSEADTTAVDQPQLIRLAGFVKTDYWIDSRAVVGAREDLVNLFPANISLDQQGKDVHADPAFNYSAIASRVALHISGPDAFGGRVTGLIEADFTGVTNQDINGMRLRHAFVRIHWEKLDLLLGQWWHPMFVTDVFPTVAALNTGAPFQPFIRNPQLTLTYAAGYSKWQFALIGQRDNASDGPRGLSPDYLRHAGLPNAHIQWTGYFGKGIVGLAADYKVLRPERITQQGYYTNERLETFAWMAYGRLRLGQWDLKAKSIYGQNMSEHLMLGGYAEASIDPSTGMTTYTPLNHFFSWLNILYGEQVQGGFFLGYASNLGSREEINGRYFGRGSDIAHVYRLAPAITFNAGRISFCTELEYTVAAYGTPDDFGKVKNHNEVGNLRLLFTALYFF